MATDRALTGLPTGGATRRNLFGKASLQSAQIMSGSACLRFDPSIPGSLVNLQVNNEQVFNDDLKPDGREQSGRWEPVLAITHQ
jgi:hypothetical protein